MREVLSRIGIIMLVLGGTVGLAFFRLTKLFGRVISVGSGKNLTVKDLEREGVCKSKPQAQQFAQVQKVIRRPNAAPEALHQANQTVARLISDVERTGSQKSAVLRATRVQVCHALKAQPLQEDTTCVAQVIRQPGYPPAVRSKIEVVLEKSGVAIGRAKD